MKQIKLGVIGGSGLYEIDGLSHLEKHRVETPFGSPSAEYLSGQFRDDVRIYFLPRHGMGHWLLPGEINYRANIFGFKMLGVDWLLSVSAVGSMKEEIHPGDMVIPDQFFDRTKSRPSTFFGEGIVAHVPFGDPVCPIFFDIVAKSSKKINPRTHVGGTYVCMEGPQFSSRAESMFYRSLQASVIGMTNLPEAKLAREAEISYATLALATDYDCWHESEEDVRADTVVEVMKQNVLSAKKIIRGVSEQMPEGPNPWKGMLKNAVVTDPKVVPAKTKEKLQILLKDVLF